MLLPHIEQTLRAFNVQPPECRKILLVDDEVDNLDVLVALLEDTWDVSAAESGPEALDLLAKSGPVDLVVADQRMPGMTGVELLTEIAKQNPDTIRIVLTAYSDAQPMLDAINSGAAYRFLLKPFDPMELRAVLADGLRLKAESSALSQLVEVLSDHRSQLDHTVSELQQSQKQLLAAERLATLGRATSGIVHDLRNASSILHILLELISRETDNPGILAAAEAARSSAGALVDMLEQVRDFAKTTSSEVVRQTTDMNDFVTTTLRLFQLEQARQACPISVHVDDAARTASFDHSRVRQAIMALLRNAIAASSAGSPVEIEVGPPRQSEIHVEVRDSGCGMDERTLVQAREPFFSGFDPRGLGLGLEVVRLAAEAHGGRLDIESTVGQGTRARLILAHAVP